MKKECPFCKTGFLERKMIKEMKYDAERRGRHSQTEFGNEKMKAGKLESKASALGFFNINKFILKILIQIFLTMFKIHNIHAPITHIP
jgi:hypothetical protein